MASAKALCRWSGPLLLWAELNVRVRETADARLTGERQNETRFLSCLFFFFAIYTDQPWLLLVEDSLFGDDASLDLVI